jgi:hypothetical protein
MCPLSEAMEIERKSGTIIYRFIRKNDIGTDIRNIKAEDIIDVKFISIVYNNYKSGSCDSIACTAAVKPVDDAKYLTKTVEDTCIALIKDGWKLFSSTKVE